MERTSDCTLTASHSISYSQAPLELAQSPWRLQRAGWFARSALICVIWFCWGSLLSAEASAGTGQGGFCSPPHAPSQAQGSAHRDCLSSQGAYLPSVLEKVPAGNLGLPGKPKPGFPGWLGSVTKLSLVSAPLPGGTWTPVLCVRWKRLKACVRKGAAQLGQAISSCLPGGLGKAGPSPGSSSTFCAW